ncbi:hypothetical protein LMG7974_00638 [Campylobacter majalis]|uniref:PpiC domain-containing protein n=1 Tax=Campylobacter majalis TaxID=2790656 RepID=A0ABN7K5V3_9BACT|nr:peptidylprolyl isomerase [Campylobacter majalis]CAD7287757.1 hypothetical protein LMG7974_00638 [Campylobacter majalis]
MITWMQKNKKYLVVTIWISTIAFVGAGFVGWGAYDMNSNRANSVAKVGHRNISIQELNDKYSQLYNYYNNILGGQLTQEKASELGLDTAALQASIRDNLLLNFADDIGLIANDSDIIKYIISDENFHRDGVFNENVYKDTLRRARINPKDYEKSLQRQILLDKLHHALSIKANKDDIKMITSSFFMSDKVAFKIINADNAEIVINEDEVRKIWEENKNNYLTKRSYSLDTIYIPAMMQNADNAALMSYYDEHKDNYKDNEDKILSFEQAKEQVQKDYDLQESRTSALKAYTELKKGDLNATEILNFDEDNAPFSHDVIAEMKVGDVLKPLLYKDGYIIGVVKGIKAAHPMEYIDAREQVLEVYIKQERAKKLETKVKSKLVNFDVNNSDVVEISRASNNEVAGLDMFESATFIDGVFSSPNKNGYVLLGEKGVIYEIVEQNLLTNVSANNQTLVSENADTLKNNEVMQDLIETLTKRYKVEEYIKR